MIKEDLEDEISNGIKAELEAQEQFEKGAGASLALLNELRVKQTDLEAAIADANDAIDGENQQRADEDAQLTEEKEYLWHIKPDCEWILKAFKSRMEKEYLWHIKPDCEWIL